MRVQLLSDLHLETEDFEPAPAPGAERLLLLGDIDSGWAALERFRAWPVPVLMVAGNHEFDRRDIDAAWPALRARCTALGITLLERESLVLTDAQGARIRFVATVRWCDFDLFGDGSVVLVPLPGHTDGSLGVFVNLRSGKRFLFTGDLTWALEGFELPAERPWMARKLVDADEAEVRRSIVKVHWLMKKYPDLIVVPAHDRRVHERIANLPNFER